jgi:23S rRNA (cytosine1962-C5)-methyltransferase
MHLMVDIIGGHKTGFYLDQRDARLAVRQIAKDKTVLNCFSYTGGFSVAAACGGARHVTSVDTSAPALELAKKHCADNAPEVPHEAIADDVFQVLRRLKAEQKSFDLVILDPPKFAHNSSQVDKACRGYKDINRIAMQLLNPGGWLATYSCSGLISADLFQKVVFSAAIEANTNMQIMKRLRQADDHPVLLTFPESEYLKGLLCRSYVTRP